MRKFSEKINEELMAISQPVDKSNEDDLLKSRIGELIRNYVELEIVPYSDSCQECGKGDEHLNSMSVDIAAKEIVEMLKKDKLI
jgi:hypothetical protein